MRPQDILLLLTICTASLGVCGLSVCAFNVQVFGRAKVSDKEIVDTLASVFTRYDIGFMQEIRDSSNESIWTLLEAINAKHTGAKYNIFLSPRLGTTSSQEQYAYFVRQNSHIQSADAYQYNGTIASKFERPPYILHVTLQDGTKIFLIGIHVKPDNAVSEIDSLADIYEYYTQLFGHGNSIILGDLNAGCSYVSKADWDSIRLRTQTRFVWAIDDATDTTTTASNCSYDRFVLVGDTVSLAVKAGVFRFDTEYNLNVTFTQDQTLLLKLTFIPTAPRETTSIFSIACILAFAFACIALV